jgi:hypothetical protein
MTIVDSRGWVRMLVMDVVVVASTLDVGVTRTEDPGMIVEADEPGIEPVGPAEEERGAVSETVKVESELVLILPVPEA